MSVYHSELIILAVCNALQIVHFQNEKCFCGASLLSLNICAVLSV